MRTILKRLKQLFKSPENKEYSPVDMKLMPTWCRVQGHGVYRLFEQPFIHVTGVAEPCNLTHLWLPWDGYYEVRVFLPSQIGAVYKVKNTTYCYSRGARRENLFPGRFRCARSLGLSLD